MARYADLDNLLADYLPEATKQSEQDAIGRILDNVSAFVDSYCRRSSGYFSAAPEEAEATERRFRGEGHHFLRLPVHVLGSIESVTVSGMEIDSESWYESEKNGWIYYENNSIGLENTFSFANSCQFYEGQIYKVTAVWGFEQIPLPVQEFCRLATKSVWETQNGVLGQISPEGFALKAQLFPPDLLLMLEQFRRREFEI